MKLRVLDIVIGGLVFLGIIFAFLFFFRKSTYINITLKVNSDSIYYTSGSTPSWIEHFFYKGMVEKDGLSQDIAEVNKVHIFKTSYDRSAVYLSTRLKVVYNRPSNQYTFRGKPVLIGSTARLYLDKVLVDGLVTHIEGINDARATQKLHVTASLREENPVFSETYGIKPYIADAIHQGDEIKDTEGKIIIKILEKKTEDAVKIVPTSDGRLVRQPEPFGRKNVMLDLEVTADLLNNRYFVYDDVPLEIGQPLPMTLNNLSVFPEITKISELK